MTSKEIFKNLILLVYLIFRVAWNYLFVSDLIESQKTEHHKADVPIFGFVSSIYPPIRNIAACRLLKRIS